jgi:hypothetical protein
LGKIECSSKVSNQKSFLKKPSALFSVAAFCGYTVIGRAAFLGGFFKKKFCPA